MTALNKVALVGTARLPEAPATGTPVDELIAGLEELTPERRVLLSAGMLSIFRRAGYVPPTAASLPAAAPPETRPACSQGAARALGDVFIDGRLELLPEAFRLLRAADQRVPFSLLVNCLDLRDPVHREAARPVLGERGVWLAHRRESWQWARASASREADAPELERIWHEERSDDRLAAIARLRDLDPTLARDLLAASWKQEPAEFRVSLLAVMGARLSRDDEEFLQTALRDRASAVRAAAASLLARLPGSTFAARAVARADAVLDITRGTVTGRPPERFNPEWESDGISAKPPRGMGERAHWLMQALALVDPSHWSQRAGMSPFQLIHGARQGEWAAVVMVGWSRAALSHNSPDWIVALWDAWLNADLSSDAHGAMMRRDLLMRLFLQMPVDAAQERVATLLQTPSLAADLDLETMLDRFGRPWPHTLAVRVLDAIDSGTANDAAFAARSSHLASLLRTAGPALPPPLFERALAISARDLARAILTGVRVDFDVFAHQIRLRQRLHQEIAT